MEFSTEIIHAYADGELQGGEKTEFEKALLTDTKLQQTLDDLYALKAQLQHAYQNVKPPVKQQVSNGSYRMLASVALLVITFTGGWFTSDVLSNRMGMSDESSVNPAMQVLAEKPGKYILHISVNDNKKFKQTLDQAEMLLANYQNIDQGIQLEIIANAGGLDLFRENASPYSQRVKHLSNEYPNIKFIACSNAVERLRKEGIEPEMINSVHHGVTAIEQVVKRVHEGWSYIKI
ncbi:MAG: hypothetical protein OQK46_02785 [Gammaproteobacteria bacterium]|nr:hypothetical protein [Gammaproteobacteria bacterium]